MDWEGLRGGPTVRVLEGGVWTFLFRRGIFRGLLRSLRVAFLPLDAYG